MNPGQQAHFQFDREGPALGLEQWRAQRQEALRQLARKIGLPLGRNVEVWLRNEIRLIGKLCLREEQLFIPQDQEAHLELVIDGVPFLPSEITCCVVKD